MVTVALALALLGLLASACLALLSLLPVPYDRAAMRLCAKRVALPSAPLLGLCLLSEVDVAVIVA